MVNELCLFAGAGGGSLASEWLLGWTTVCYVEREKFPIDILKARIRDGLLADAPIWDDVKTFDGRPWRGCVDIVTAGFPCQPFSISGERRANADDRNGWPDTIRIIREVEPKLVFLENVPGLLSAADKDGLRYFGTILSDLATSGYDARWRVLSAVEVGAPHKRDRLWIVAYANGSTGQEQGGAGQKIQRPEKIERPGRRSRIPGNVSDTGPQGLSVSKQEIIRAAWRGKKGGTATQQSWWATEPEMGRVAYGVADRVGSLKAIGNGQVPLVASTAWRLLTRKLL